MFRGRLMVQGGEHWAEVRRPDWAMTWTSPAGKVSVIHLGYGLQVLLRVEQELIPDTFYMTHLALCYYFCHNFPVKTVMSRTNYKKAACSGELNFCMHLAWNYWISWYIHDVPNMPQILLSILMSGRKSAKKTHVNCCWLGSFNK